MTVKQQKEILLKLDLSVTEKMVLVGLISYADQGGTCWPSYSTLAKLTSLSRRSVIRAIRSLEQKQIISREPRGASSNVYLLNLKLLNSVGGEPDSPGGDTESPALVTQSHPKKPIEVTNEATKEEAIEETKKENKEIPSFIEVKEYAEAIELPADEIIKLYRYYSSFGWKQDWRKQVDVWKQNWLESVSYERPKQSEFPEDSGEFPGWMHESKSAYLVGVGC